MDFDGTAFIPFEWNRQFYRIARVEGVAKINKQLNYLSVFTTSPPPGGLKEN